MATIEEIKRLVNAPSNILSEESLEKLFNLMEEVHFTQNEPIVREGEYDDHMYIAKDGVFRGFISRGNKELTLYFGVDGDITIAMTSFFKGDPSALTIEACCDTVMLRISKVHLLELINGSLEFSNWIVDKAFSQFYWFEKKGTVITGDASEKYLNLLKNRPELLQKVPLRTISSYLGITQQSLSRLRNPNYNKNKNRKD